MAGSEKGIGKEDKGLDPNAWMTTFGDLVMLLLTFFVLLLTMSSMDQKQLKELFSHLKASTGVLGFSGSRQVEFDQFIKDVTESGSKIVLDNEALSDLFKLSVRIDRKIEGMERMDRALNITDDERGLVLSFKDHILFEQGRADIKKDAYEILDAIGTSIQSCANDILIMGHTDNVPVESEKYASNWELSSYRGLSVLRYFVEERKMSASRFFAGGYGDARPLYRNDTPKRRAANRRVEIIFRNVQGG
ncbi:MAG: OmpA family protein [Desulfobacterales bacterium]